MHVFSYYYICGPSGCAGDGVNRFYDKALQFIVLPDGNCGFLGEHALADGAPTARMCSEVPTAKTFKKKVCGFLGKPALACTARMCPEVLKR
jgi:hypothetical protein